MVGVNIVSHIPDLSGNKGNIISIFGPSGLGKTTLALQTVSYYLTQEGRSQSQCVWIQASEQFPKKRLHSLFKDNPGKGGSLLRNIFVYPVNGPFQRYRDQSVFIRKMRDIILPFDTRFVVIDNISNHLRLASSLYSDMKKKSFLLDEFFSSQLFPLIMRCLRENIILILIHEVSFNPNSGKTKSFFDKLYSRINSITVSLSKNPQSGRKYMEISLRGHEGGCKTHYEIKSKGLVVQ